jgi:hypothetical protein
VTGVSAVSSRLKIDSCILLHKKGGPLSKLLNKRPRVVTGGRSPSITDKKRPSVTLAENPFEYIVHKPIEQQTTIGQPRHSK